MHLVREPSFEIQSAFLTDEAFFERVSGYETAKANQNAMIVPADRKPYI